VWGSQIGGRDIFAKVQLGTYDVWHDRAVFHFLTSTEERVAYVAQVASAVKSGGHVMVSTFGPEGPTKCGGLDVVRYDAESRLSIELSTVCRCQTKIPLNPIPWDTATEV
jgi:hypothetical protein